MDAESGRNGIVIFSDAYEHLLERVAELTLGHVTPHNISQKLNIGRAEVARAQGINRMRWQERAMAKTEEWVEEELARLDQAEKSIWPGIMNGDDKAVNTLLKIMDFRSRLLGLQAPKKVDITVRIRELAIENGLDPDEAVREAQKLLRSGRFED